MGLLEPYQKPSVPCIFGAIMLGEVESVGGSTLDCDDIAMLEHERATLTVKSGRPVGGKHFRDRLLPAFPGICAGVTIDRHLNGDCSCPPGTPLLPRQGAQ